MTTTTTDYDTASRPTEAATVVTVDGTAAPGSGTSFTHDALGNLTEVAGAATATTYSYDGFARLSRVAREVAGLPAPVTQDLSYDPYSRTHQKTTKLVAPGEVALTTRSHSYRGDSGELVTTTEAASGPLAGPALDTAYALGPAGTIAERVQQGGEEAVTRIVGSSPHHDVTYLTDPEGRVLATRSYDPWGVTRSATGAPSYLGYQGDPTDADTTLVDMGARSYLPELGRFLTQDPLHGDPMNPLTLNPYIYGAGDPVSNWDPDGMCPRPSVCGPDQRQNERNYERQEHLTFDFYAKKNSGTLPGYDPPYVAGVQHELPPVGSVLSLGRDVIAELSGFNDALRCLQGDKTSCAMLAIAIGPGKFLKGFRLADEAADATQTTRAVATSGDDLTGALCRTNSFVPETLVLMADGTTKPIADVRVGDLVMATDPETGDRGARRVTDTIVGDGTKELVDIEIDGNVITATDRHPFWVDDAGRWVDAEDLEVGDVLLLDDGTTVDIDAVRERTEVRRVNNLTVDGIHTYYALVGESPVLVHNCVQDVIDETLASRGSIASQHVLSADDALTAGQHWVGPGYRELGRPGSGVFRSADELRQFRIDVSSLTGAHAPGVPHVHFERFLPGARRPFVNNHVPFL